METNLKINSETLPDKIAQVIAIIFNKGISFISKIVDYLVNARDFILSLMNRMEYVAVT